jgi:hypothetical protein
LPSGDLKAIRIQRFGKLSEAESRLLYVAPRGEAAVCSYTSDPRDLANDPADSDNWGSERVIRAELIRWLCVDQAASNAVDRRGIRIFAAKITGKLDLSYSTVSFPLCLEQCRLTDDALLKGVKIPELILNGSHTRCLMAEEAEVKGNLLLQHGFTADGEVRLIAAQIGTLNCEGSSFSNSGGCSDPSEEKHIREAIRADRMKVGGGVFFNKGFQADGEVSLNGAFVGGDLSCKGGSFRNLNGYAISAENVTVGQNVLLFGGFTAYGKIELFGAKIGQSLNCYGGVFDFVILNEATIKGLFVWSKIQNANVAELDLRNASVGSLADDEESWPQNGHLRLDGFEYQRISDTPLEEDFLEASEESSGKKYEIHSPMDAPTRLKWLDRQPQFKPQPYRQLAKVLREMGNDDGAKEVLFELESRAREEQRKRLNHSPLALVFQSGEDVIYDATVGYGVYPGRALWCLCTLTALGWIVHRRAQRVGAMVPTEQGACETFHGEGVPPSCYTPFNPFIYSLENCLPVIKLGQDERWQPDPNPKTRVAPVSAGKCGRAVNWLFDLVPGFLVTPTWLRFFRWVMIIVGWVLAIYFVDALTGVIKTN